MSVAAIDSLIKSGNYNFVLDALKGFRNGVSYGIKVRAPHSLVMTVIWSPSDPMTMAKKIFQATKNHGMNLGKFAFVFKTLIGILKRMPGGEQTWHAALVGAICGYLFWGERTPVNIQVNMYLLSRITSGFLFLWMTKSGVQLGEKEFRIYAAVMWACVMYLFYHHPSTLQGSLQSSMNYIYRDSDKYTGLYDLLIRNSDKAI